MVSNKKYYVYQIKVSETIDDCLISDKFVIILYRHMTA